MEGIIVFSLSLAKRLGSGSVIWTIPLVIAIIVFKVIGKQGRIAKAIRTVVKAVANSNGKRVIVDISENQD